MRTKRTSLRRCSWRSITLPQAVGLLMGSLAIACLLYQIIDSSKRRHESRLVEHFQKDKEAFESYWESGKRPSSIPTAHASSGVARRGIVICAGGDTLLTNVYISIKVLRGTLKSSLPIEIYYNGPRDIQGTIGAALAEFEDVRFIDLSTLPFPAHHTQPQLFNGYVQKIFSLYSTNFEQVLLLDADSQPLVDPAQLFDSPSFLKTGNLFWSDFWAEGLDESPEANVYKWLGLAAPWTYLNDWRCAESGQVLFDRVRHADVLEWVWFLNAHAELLYKHMLGDKDTFEIAFVLAGKEALYNRNPLGPGLPLSRLQTAVFHDKLLRRTFGQEEESQRYLRLGMLQFDENGKAAFLHRTERTKFAQKKNGYSLDVMQPYFFIPPLSTHTTLKVRWLVWRMHSVPVSMADVNCTCCALDQPAKAVLKRTSVDFKLSDTAGKSDCHIADIPRLPVFQFSALGEKHVAAVEAAFAAYESLQSLVKHSLRTRL